MILLFCLSYAGKAALTARQDSVVNLLHTYPSDTTRLNKIVEIARLEQGSTDISFYIDLLHDEAMRQDAPKYIYTACYFRFVSEFNRGHYDSLVVWRDRIKQMAYEQRDFYNYFKARRFLVESYYLRDDFEKAVDEGLKMKEEAVTLGYNDGVIAANLAIALADQALGQLAKATNLLEESLLIPSSKAVETRLDILLRLVSLYSDREEASHLRKSLDRLFELLVGIITESPEKGHIYIDYFYYMQVMQGNYYLMLNDLDGVAASMRKAEYYLTSDIYYLYQYAYYLLRVNYFIKKEQYQEALAANERAMQLIKTQHPVEYASLEYRKARLLALGGQSAAAAALYNYVFVAIDSLRQDFSAKQVDQILVNYDFDKALYDRKQYERKSKIVILSAFLFLLVIIIYYSWKYISLRGKLKESARVIEKACCDIERVNEDKNLFMRNICHDIRSYLTSIVGFSELISDTHQPDDEKRQYQQIIETNSTQLTQLINSILELSRHEVGKITFGKERFDLIELLGETVSQVPIRSEAFSWSAKRFVLGDRARFQQVFFSLFEQGDAASLSTSFIHIYDFTSTNRASAEIEIRIYGSWLSRDTDQLYVFTRNEINRCSVEKQSGCYCYQTDEDEIPFISIKMPVVDFSE